MVDFLSGKVRKTPPTEVPSNRYKFLKLQDAEPDLGVASGNGHILTTNELGVRVWKQPSDISGFLGSTGYTGSQGIQGFTGSRGFTGSAGPAGGEGSIGYTGSQGFTGSKGDVGFTGSRGAIGFTGSQGIQGYTGSQGFTGSKGDVGFTGSQGIQGIQGFAGSRGDTGFVGSQGFTGSKGDVGFTGSQGPIGFTGSSGFTGSQGIQGWTGSRGDTGFTGSRGFTGSVGPIAGTDGQLIYNNGGISGGANTWFDDTNQRLGIKTSSPSATLDVVGDIEVNSNVNLNSEATNLATTAKTQIAAFPVASFRSGKLVVQAYDTFTNEVQVSELLVAHNGTTASATEYSVVYTGANPLVVYDVDISSENVRLLAQRTTPNPTQYTVSETLLSAFDPAFGAFSWDSNTASPGPA